MAVAAVAFAGVNLLVRAAIRVYFGRLHVSHRERFPAHGAVLLVANHPAMWTDVLVLDVALGRKLHFLAQGQLFLSPARAAILRLHGALPVRTSGGGVDARSRNQETFDRCREIFDRGGVVAVFPEGVSQTDRTVLRLKTGAARVALGGPLADPATRELLVIPAGIHYASRTSYGSEVTVSVGEPIALEPYRALMTTDPDAAVHALTAHMHRSLSELTLDLPEPALAAAVAELEPLAVLSSRAHTPELESAQRIAARLDQMRVAEPARFEGIRRHSRAYRRARRALRLSARALLWAHRTPPWRQRLGVLAALCVLGAVPAAVGAVLHAAPWGAGEWIARKVVADPVRFSFARIASGMVLFPLMYAVLMVALMRMTHTPASHAPLVLVALVALGLWTLRYSRWARALAERFRLMVLERRHPRLVGRARGEQRALLRLLADRVEPPTAGRRGAP